METDLGTFTVVETPGHAPSHVCLHQPERRLLISGDHLLGRVSPYFDVGWSDDPVEEFLSSLARIETLDVRLALAGHGRPFTDVLGHIAANRNLIEDNLARLSALLAEEPLSAFDLAPRLFGDAFGAATGAWLFTETMAFLTHLERRGEARRIPGGAGGKPGLRPNLSGMRIDELLERADRPVFSFEFFPPKTEEGERNLVRALEALGPQQPDFVSVTYGAGGTTRDKTIDIVKRIKSDFGMEAMAHLTCVNATMDEVRAHRRPDGRGRHRERPRPARRPAARPAGLDQDRGWLRVQPRARDRAPFRLPLRDRRCRVPGDPHPRDVADDDLRHLKAKVDAGAQFLITQMFFDNAYYFDFVERARAIGVHVPILPGVMPILSSDGIKRMTELSAAKLPAALVRELDARRGDDEAVAELGVSYATLQCADLLAGGAPGIHFITLNRSPATRAILSALKVFEPGRAPATA